MAVRWGLAGLGNYTGYNNALGLTRRDEFRANALMYYKLQGPPSKEIKYSFISHNGPTVDLQGFQSSTPDSEYSFPIDFPRKRAPCDEMLCCNTIIYAQSAIITDRLSSIL